MKYKAITFSYDDGVEQDKRLIEILERYGLRATFNLNSGLFDKRTSHSGRVFGFDAVFNNHRIPGDEICEVYKNHEIPPILSPTRFFPPFRTKRSFFR